MLCLGVLRKETREVMIMWRVVQADVLEWAKEYKQRIEQGQAEPFSALLCDPP